MAKELAALSDELAVAVERAGRSVVAVHARPRFSSSVAATPFVRFITAAPSCANRTIEQNKTKRYNPLNAPEAA